MRTFKVRLFELPPATPTASPKEVPGFAVDAEDIDGARIACAERLHAWHYDVRAISCLAGGESALAAVVYERSES